MPSHRSDYATVEWSFLTNDHRFYDLPLPERLAYIGLWVYSVATRRDWWSPNRWRIALDNVAIHTRIHPDCVSNMAVSALANGLISRKPGGAYLLDGVRDKHAKLRGWCPKWGSARDPSKERRGEERKGKQSKGAREARVASGPLSIDDQIQALEQKAALTDGETFSLALLRKQKAVGAMDNPYA